MKLKSIVKASVLAIAIGFIFTGIGYAINGSLSLNNVLVYTNNNQDIKYLSKEEELEPFNNIDIKVDVNDIKIIPSDKYKIEFRYDEKNDKVEYKVEDEILVLKQEAINKNDYSINLKKEDRKYINIYVPTDIILEDITITSDVANVNLNNIASKYLDITCNVGNIKAKDCYIKDVKLKSDTGNIDINKLNSNYIEAYSNIGNIVMKDSINIGKLKMSSDIGNIEVDGKIYGESNISANVGNVEVNIDEDKKMYNYNIKNDLGSFKVDGKKYKKELKVDNKSENNINIQCDTGKIELNFR
ncbi:MAG: DUF4097 family beta strand repeat-containing protein [Paraclostridium sp.]